MHILIFFALTVVILLGLTAGFYQWRLYQTMRLNSKTKQERDDAALARLKNNRRSIEILVQALEQGQMSITEGAIRISALLNATGYERMFVDESNKQTNKKSSQAANDIDVFYQLAEATAHIPILEQWAKLSKKDQLKFDKQRDTLEKEFEARILKGCAALKRHDDFFISNNATIH